ncbi:outer membrane beta-barrel protein [Breoghania sp. L-A4]|uniref:outer membrane protein n=1 Tax=Breoghania sp. L-A4 TaxID=2304600 RepID=UPI000E35B106|nr:outer membrane beta-barrel protein [Breoghania sp. L-A4]AXS39118.1 porin family protein [Breoghania sp. L-A4]
MRGTVAGILFACALVGPSVAADPSRGTPSYYSPAPVYTWTGLYAGGHIGYGRANFSNDIPASAGPTGYSGSVIGGAQLGYNHQFSGNWVVGAEADFSLLDIKGSAAPGSFTEDWMATARLRAGYAFSRYLAYATAGIAFTHAVAKRTGFGSGDSIITGFTAGAGLEGKINERWSARLEYLYVGVPKETINAGGVNVVGGSNNHIARFGINYHF